VRACAEWLVFESASFQDAFCATPDAVPALVALYDGCTSRRLLVAVTRAVCSAVRHNTAAQTSFINAGVAPFISAIIALKVSSFSLYSRCGKGLQHSHSHQIIPIPNPIPVMPRI